VIEKKLGYLVTTKLVTSSVYIYILSVYPNHMMSAYSHPLQAGIVNVKSVPQPLVAVLM
jgi:hypothetical protein